MTFVWERLADGLFRCRLRFLDVAVGLVYCRAGAMLIDTGSTLTEARADSDPVAWQATLERVFEAGGEGAVFVPGHGAVVDAAFIRRQQDWLRTQM